MSKDSKGQTDKVSYPQDTAGNHPLKDTKGGKMGGSVTNLSHSLSGTSAVQK